MNDNARAYDDLEELLNATRISLYEQTKHMTTQERVAFFNKRGRDVLARQGIKAKVTELPVVRQNA
ncbi:MAG: hypothetical protein FWD16_06915 [Clostridia bacterium]|nr:hypothetical protein [Clostridia bacterium]